MINKKRAAAMAVANGSDDQYKEQFTQYTDESQVQLRDLYDKNIWVVWKEVLVDGTLKKNLYSPHTGRQAKSNDPKTWGNREQALQRKKSGDFKGIGLMLGKGIAGIDLDTCRDKETGIIDEWASEIIRRFNTYAEISPSGTGAKLFFLSDAPMRIPKFTRGTGKHPKAIETYFKGRYFTVTGDDLNDDIFGDATPLRKVSQADLEWLANVAGPKFEGIKPTVEAKEPLELSEAQITDTLARLAKRTEWVERYDKWLEVGMALHHQYDGAGEGLEHWLAFSEKASSFNEDECEAKWKSFKVGGKTFASLRFAVRDELNVEKFSEPESIGTDTQNAEAFAARYKDDLLYIYPGPVAHKWDGVSYVECRQADDSEAAIRFAVEQLQAAVQIQNTDGIKEATKLQNRKRQTDMLALAKALPALKAHTDEFNLDPWLLGVGNGVINLKTGEHIAGDRSQRISKRAGTFFDAKATCPQWDRFLEQVLPDKEVRDFLQRAIGYTLTGDVSEDVLFFLVGTGANGKTVLTDILAKLMGDHRHTLNKSTLLQRKFESDESLRDIIKLQHMRLALASELSAGERWNDGALKALVQTSEISGRDLYKSKVTFKPTHKLWICSNSEPRADDQSDGLWRRICKVPFNVTIPPDQRDAKLSEKLAGELPGILNWAIAGCLAWQRDGRLVQPEAVKIATSDYRKSNDTVARWLEGRFKRNPQSRLLVKAAHDNYVQFCEGEGLHYLDRSSFGLQMKTSGFESKHGMQGRYYVGVSLQIEPGGFDVL
jgi:putative DNA primase/helicase